jgi:hypothetical protein
MIPVLEAAVKDGWHHLVTRNELWFFLSYSPRRMWTLARDEIVTKPRRGIQTAKLMFTIIRNPLGFHVINKLPTSPRMNSEYTPTNILAQLEEKLFPKGRITHTKRLIVHMDNCSMQTSRAQELCPGFILGMIFGDHHECDSVIFQFVLCLDSSK